MNARHKTKTENSIGQRIHNGIRLRLQDNGGFTLVELIVVLIVLGILMSLAVMSLIGWQNYADFKQNNEFAKSIFQAAQIQLTQYGERGQLTELIDAVTDGGKAARSEYMLSEQGELQAGDDIWEKGYAGNIYYLMAEKGDYANYVENLKGLTAAESRALSAKDRRIKALFDMIDPYVADKAMLDAAICVEFDPDPKVVLVYSVFYNHKADRFTYEDTGSGEMSGGTAPIRDRSADTRKKAKTGYYGAETMARGTDTYISRPVISNVRLNNEDTLNLSWTTKGDNGKELTRLIYTIDIYGLKSGETGDGKRLMAITLGKVGPAADEKLPVIDGRVSANVSWPNAEGTSWTPEEEYTFPITVDTTENMIALVLDGLDLYADEKTAKADLKETASIRRLNLDTDMIYAVITGSRSGVYDITTKKRSNSEHQYFGGMTVNEDDSVTYAVENARHLNNIRYQEAEYAANDGTGAPEFIYQISRDISWEYTLNKGNVYREMVQQFPVNGDISPYYFKPILALRYNSALQSDNGEQGRTLTKFRFSALHTADDGNRDLGLVGENKGIIRNLSMQGVYVDGLAEMKDAGGTVYAASAGAFCGVNKGILSNLSVTESFDHVVSEVRGLSYVGGIAGRSGIPAVGDDRQVYEKLTNRANVSGQRYVGGITGSLETNGGKITVSGCQNYGKVRGRILETGKEAYFFGGIAGYAGSAGVAGTGAAGQILLSDCQSSPYYTDTEITGILENISKEDSQELVENFVGGIVGYNDVAELLNCNTEQEQTGRKGYVVGKDYVGGIVGYNSGKVSLTGGSNNRNQVHVIGHSFIGGIAGCNAAGELKEQDGDFAVETVADTLGKYAMIAGWINEGLVTATGDFTGGITGFNGQTGVIEDSYSNVEYDSNAQTLAQISSNARFAGGIAGYNNGRIGRTSDAGTLKKVTTVSVISGKDYVGGVVGCNDVYGKITDYEMEGGYVEGSHFVGGFVGLNMTPEIFSGKIRSNPNKVSGDYFVGGVIGGNLVPVSGDLSVSFETDNFLGDLVAEKGAFAGGFIGYNYLLTGGGAAEETGSAAETAGGMMKTSHILAAANKLCTDEQFRPLDESDDEVLEGEKLESTLNGCLQDYANESARMVITGEGTSAAQQNLGSVRGKIYIGGVVGYNQPSTWLTIKDVKNITPVEASGYIELIEEGMQNLHYFSYAGGMIGKVGERVTLDNCSNRDAGEVRGKGTYTGGLAEINFGTVKNCTAGNIGDGTASYVGGIVGVNASKGSLTDGKPSSEGNGRGLLIDCSVGGQISGVSYVGGLAAENYGVIRYTDQSRAGEAGTDPTVDASGRYVGGLVGFAHEGGEIRIDGDVVLDINVSGSAMYVGGIAGVNAGIIKAADGTNRYYIENDKENMIIGRNYVGGFIGMQLEPQDGVSAEKNSTVTLRRFVNHAGVQASYGYAGGIVAIVQKTLKPEANKENKESEKHAVTDKVIFERCENRGKVEVLSEEDHNDEVDIQPDKGDADSDYTIIPDTDDEGVASAGGITAVNHGIIKQCGNYGEVSANSGYIGGIAAFNYHKIDRSETASMDTSAGAGSTQDALELSGDLRVGGIAAINQASIKRCAVRSVILRNQSSSESGLMGGIAAWNEGDIEDCFVGVGLNPKELADNDKSDIYSSVYSGLREEAAEYVKGGMEQATFQKSSGLQGNSVLLVSYAADVNMGGIAGQNEKKISGAEHVARGSGYYSVVAADLRFDSESMNYFGNIGGIAGVNGGTIEKYEFSGYIRGSAGDPAKTPEYSPAYDMERNGSKIYGYGGIAGSNGSDQNLSNTAEITQCYIGMAKIEGTGDGSNRANVGGVAGFNGTGASIERIMFSQMEGELGDRNHFSHPIEISYTERPYHKDDKDPTKWNPYPNKFTDGYGNTWERSGNQWKNGKTVWKNEWTGKKGEVWEAKSGTVWLNVTNYGHLGGVAGYNRGTISDINWTSDYVNSREIEGSSKEGYFPNGSYTEEPVSEVDGTGVLITSSAGLVGGITGYNHRTGSVSNAVTGRNWLVSASSQQLGDGIGGIIGYNISEQDIISCDNHATVYKIADDAVGGITGCQETGTSSSWRYFDCKNYGKLYAQNRGGGIIGVWKYKGGTLEECQNYGEVCSLHTCGGGIVSLVEAVSEGEIINLTRCENFGEVYSNNNEVILAGILSYVDDSQSPIDIQISECVNTGNMIGSYRGGELTGRGGIFATSEGDSNVDIRYCRNYSFIREDSRYYGITKGTENTKLQYCFGAANGNTKIKDKDGTWGLQYPLSEAGNVEDSYYFVDSQSIKSGTGKPIEIESNRAVYYTKKNGRESSYEVIVPDMGTYGTNSIVFPANDERTRRHSYESYQLCKGVDGKKGLDVYLQKVGTATGFLPAPVLGTPTLAENGEYMVSWNPVSGTRYYTVVCDYLDANEKVIGSKSSTVYTNSALISSTFEAESGYASGVKVKVQACGGDSVSDYSNEVQILFETRLPYPQISWQLENLSEKGFLYRVVLDNKDEYRKFVEENRMNGVDPSDSTYEEKVQEELKQIQIFTTGIEGSFNAWEGGYKTKKGEYDLLAPPTAGNANRQTVTSYAKYAGSADVGQSVQVIRESQFPGKTYYDQSGNPTGKNEKFADVKLEQTETSTDIGFAGKTADELAYYLQLENTWPNIPESQAATYKPWEVYFRSEMMAIDPELKVPVAVSVAEQTPIPSTRGETISVKLSNFPGDFLEKTSDGINETYRYQNVRVRTYPTFMANNVVLQGWKLSEDEYTADELRALQVTNSGELDDDNDNEDDGSPLIEDSDSVKAGYVIVWAGKNGSGDSIYSVYYNTLLKYALEDKRPGTKYGGQTYMEYQIFYHEIDLASAINNVQPKPVAFVNASYNETGKKWENGAKYDESDRFILTWDQASFGGKPAYLGAEPELSGKDENYQNAVYRLTVTGTAADGKTTVLENEKEMITADRTGTGYNTYIADSGNWDYTNIHVKLTRVGIVNENGITTKFPSAVELDFPMRRRLSQVKDVKVSLKRNEQGVVIKDALQYDISFIGITEEAEKNALSAYRITIKSLNDTSHMKTLDVRPEDIRIDGSGRMTADLDLTGFRTERISITVQAVAKTDSMDHRSGLASPAREMRVPNRLYPPQMGKPEGKDENNMTALNDSKDRVLTVKEFTEAALTLNMKADDYGTETAQVKYQIAIGLYDSEAEAKAGEHPIEAADAGLPEKSDDKKETMTYSTVNGEYRYVLENLPITYAGKWVRVVLRSLGSNSISSVWTDEADPEDTGIDNGIPSVEPYMVFKLPSVQVDAVHFKELEEAEAWENTLYTVYEGEEPAKDDSGAGIQVSAGQRWVWFDTVEYADDYRITMVQTPQQADEKAMTDSDLSYWQVSDVNWITLVKKTEDTYEVTYRSTEYADEENPAQSSFTIEIGKEEELPYFENVRILNDRPYYIQAAAKLRLEPGENGQSVSVGILLPDCRIDDASAGMVLYERTEQILVQSVARVQESSGVNESSMGAYRDSKWALVSWSGDDLVQSTDPIEQDQEAIEPSAGPASPAEVTTEISNVVYTSALEGTTRYLVKVSDGSGNELGIFGVPVNTKNATIGAFVQSVWFSSGFSNYKKPPVRLEFQSIFDVSSSEKGGLSKGYTQVYQVELPKLPVAAEETLVTSRMAEPMQYRIQVTENTGLWRRRRVKASDNYVLTASQKTLVWEYDLSDTTVTGYELEIGGSQMEHAFKEMIDLHRGLFGVMPGLKEYLGPDGKLLYTVDYHVDGEMVLNLAQRYPVASDSDAEISGSDMATASNSDAFGTTAADKATASDMSKATASDLSGELNVLTLECRLFAEYVEAEDGESILRFILMLPDLSFDWMQEEAAELYQEAFEEGLYQTESFRLLPVMSDRYYKKPETLLDLIEMRGDLQE